MTRRTAPYSPKATPCYCSVPVVAHTHEPRFHTTIETGGRRRCDQCWYSILARRTVLGACLATSALVATGCNNADSLSTPDSAVVSDARYGPSPTCNFSKPGLDRECRQELAYRLAPVIYQEVDEELKDLITKFDFDGDIDPTNQREHLREYPLPGHVYFVVVEGKTHRFVGYGFYHPDDYKTVFGHENDMEGIMLMVGYPDTGSEPGKVLLMQTFAHNQLYQYYNGSEILDRCRLELLEHEHANTYQTRDGAISFNDGRPEVFVEARGHGVYAYPQPFEHPRFIRYAPTREAQGDTVPKEGNGFGQKDMKYALEALEESVLWEHNRNEAMYDRPFDNWNGRDRDGAPLRRDFVSTSARPPWAWDDSNDKGVYAGDWYLAPAYAVAHHLLVPGLAESLNDDSYYVYHPLLEKSPKGNPSFEKLSRHRLEDRGECTRGRTEVATETVAGSPER